MEKVIYGYARVSTANQSYDIQVDQLKARGIKEENIFSEIYTGATIERPQFNALREKLKSGDEVVFTKLDRFARNTVEGLEFIEWANEQQITVTILNMGTFDNTHMGKLLVTVMLAVAEVERTQIRERLETGQQALVEKQGYVYRKRPEATQYIIELHQQGKTIQQIAEAVNLSPSTVKRRIRNFKENGGEKNE